MLIFQTDIPASASDEVDAKQTSEETEEEVIVRSKLVAKHN